MFSLFPWLVALVYLVPIIGTLVTMRRRVGQIWSLGKSLRNFLPEDRVYRRIKVWEGRYRSWKGRHLIASYINQDLLNLTAGKIEYAFGHFRDYTIGLYMMGRAVFDLTVMVIGDPAFRSERFFSLFYHGTFALLSLWTYRRHVATGLQMTEFMRVNPHVHPQEFFEHYYRRLGPAAIPVPLKASRTVNPIAISYLSGKRSQRTLLPLLHAVYDTAIFARSAFKALETIGGEYGREVFDVMASLWGSRILQLFRARLIVEGTEKLRSLTGKVILIFNHKSHLDFVFNFFALSSTPLGSGRNIRPRYMAAKDHLVDNKFIYSGLGVGQLIENVDMVFVDRKGKGKNSIEEACQKLVEREIEIAMYPQGTRAIANKGPRGERLDAGYYTTGSANSLKRELGHLKKGCAYLALNTAAALKVRGAVPVHLVPIGIDGTATLIPKGSFKVQTEGTVKFTVGEIITLDSPDSLDQSIDHLQEKINRGLVQALQLHGRLKDRFLNDVKGEEGTSSLLFFNHRLTQADREGDLLPFEILDRIYALPSDEQRIFRGDLARRLTSGEELASLRDKVTDLLFRHRGKELKTMVRQEETKRVEEKV